jgi:hypothetical protein
MQNAPPVMREDKHHEQDAKRCCGHDKEVERKGHFFVVLADRDHVFFEYQPKHTSKAVSEMFRGFHGYIQADANAVYDALFRGRPSVSLWEEEIEDPQGCRFESDFTVATAAG